MNKELGIKVGKWNNSILWCTVEKASDCAFMLLWLDTGTSSAIAFQWKWCGDELLRSYSLNCALNGTGQWINRLFIYIYIYIYSSFQNVFSAFGYRSSLHCAVLTVETVKEIPVRNAKRKYWLLTPFRV